MQRLTNDRATRLLAKIDKRIKIHERFLMKVGYILSLNRYTDKEKKEILSSACWVDGTIEGQVHHAQNERAKLKKSYQILRNRFIELGIIPRY